MRCLLPGCGAATAGARYLCPPHTRAAEAGENALSGGRPLDERSTPFLAADVACLSAMELLGLRRLVAHVRAAQLARVRAVNPAHRFAPDRDDGMCRSGGCFAHPEDADQPCPFPSGARVPPASVADMDADAPAASPAPDDAGPCDGACYWMEGEQFEGAICPKCDARADGRGGVVQDGDGSPVCLAPGCRRLAGPEQVCAIHGAALFGGLRRLQRGLAPTPRQHAVVTAVTAWRLDRQLSALPDAPPTHRAPVVWPLARGLSPVERGLLLTARQTPGIVLSGAWVGEVSERLQARGLLTVAEDGGLWPVPLRAARGAA